MMKRVTLTQHVSVERWNSWIVAAPDNMEDDRIQQLMRQLWYDGKLETGEEEIDGDDLSVDVSDPTRNVATPHITLAENGVVDEESLLTAFTTDRLQSELERRRTMD